MLRSYQAELPSTHAWCHAWKILLMSSKRALSRASTSHRKLDQKKVTSKCPRPTGSHSAPFLPSDERHQTIPPFSVLCGTTWSGVQRGILRFRRGVNCFWIPRCYHLHTGHNQSRHPVWTTAGNGNYPTQFGNFVPRIPWT